MFGRTSFNNLPKAWPSARGELSRGWFSGTGPLAGAVVPVRLFCMTGDNVNQIEISTEDLRCYPWQEIIAKAEREDCWLYAAQLFAEAERLTCSIPG